MRPTVVRAGLAVFVLLVAACPLTAVAQEQEEQKSGFEDFLKGAVRDLVDEQLADGSGKIESVAVVNRESGEVELMVRLRGVNEPHRLALAADLYDLELAPVPDVETEHVSPLPQSGAVPLRVRFSGAGTLRSSALRISLVDRDTGRALSHKRMKFVHRWTGLGSAGPGGGEAGSSLEAKEQSQQAEVQEPETILLHPDPVGDTPARNAGASTSGDPEKSSVVGQTLSPGASGTESGDADKGQARTSLASRLRGPTFAAVPSSRTTVDLYALAPKASWRSTEGALPFNGKRGDRRGFVRALGRRRMADGSVQEKVLQTHPAWKAGGTITGRFSVKIPAGASRFESDVGFLPGASGSDGVYAKVSLVGKGTGQNLVVRRVLPSHGMVKLAADIPKPWRGKTATVLLTVQAGGSSAQDWFAWTAPSIR